VAGPQTQTLADMLTRLEQGPLHTNEDPKARRRRLFRLASEERPAFPMQQKNFYGHVMENKEVVKMLSLLSTCTQDIKLVRDWTLWNSLGCRLGVPVSGFKT
jgi:dynein heavy chain